MDSSASPKPEQPTASTNAAAIADLLGNPTAQQQHDSWPMAAMLVRTTLAAAAAVATAAAHAT